jgi:Fe(3+) dicitrate transport protein
MRFFKNILLISFILSFNFLSSQNIISGKIISSESKQAIKGVEIFEKNIGKIAQTNSEGFYEFSTKKNNISLIFFAYNYNVYEQKLNFNGDTIINKELLPLSKQLIEVEITQRKQKIFEIKRLNDIEGTSIYAGKKNEVILVNQSMANLASNNARQIYSQVSGLNIYQNDDAGLQLNIGGRGLDPNRTANFNTRQNGYDISADVLGYPESYYAPASEGLEEIQIIRGAASLQYGTQFGGLVNFIMKKPNLEKNTEIISRNTIGSNQLYTNYTSLSGRVNKFSYISFINYKRGNGFRPNSKFESSNIYTHIGYELNSKLKLSTEITFLDYLAQQAGGLSDMMFNQNSLQSNRERNWFKVGWLLYNFQVFYTPSKNNSLSLNLFGLKANRYALGFRTNRVSQIDSFEERDLIKSDFNNFGFEAKYLKKYLLNNHQSAFLIGTKFYKADNYSEQGPGSDSIEPDFNFDISNYPNYNNQSNYRYPNLNIALFGENIFKINNSISITPGIRFEHIKTESIGFYKKINLDGADNVILDSTIYNNNNNERKFVLFGTGLSYKKDVEIYGNISQNYRSVTFADISIINPAFVINPNIKDEKGFTIDLGIRGDFKNIFSYDISGFNLFYNDRIGFVQKEFEDGSVKSERGNVGDAKIYGLETLIDININKLISEVDNNIFTFYINTSFINSEYIDSDKNGIIGNRVEFIPKINLKSGIRLGYKNILTNLQFTFLSDQFTDASNALESNLSGVIGLIPSYNVLDLSASYKYKKLKFEFGINNMLDNKYFTRRATGYPGPGIIPSPNRNIYTTIEIRL